MTDIIVSFFRDEISGSYYVIYCIVCLTLLFAIIGYLFKQKYGKVEFKLAPKKEKKIVKNDSKKTKKKDKKKGAIEEVKTPITSAPIAQNPQPRPATPVASASPKTASLADIPTTPTLNAGTPLPPTSPTTVTSQTAPVSNGSPLKEPIIENKVEGQPTKTTPVNTGSIPDIK